MFKKILAKLKTVKNIELYVVAVCALVVVLIVVFTGNSASSSKSSGSDDYSCFVENKIQGILEKIDGCGKTEVAVLCSSDQTKSSSTFGFSSDFTNFDTSDSVINQNSSNIIGVVIAAEGAADPVVKYKIVKAVVTLLAIDPSCVQVFTYIS